uniref:Uncharacterized protein n=1 Tax=Ditylum brightwellii TaxID=49249 RepID=A0A7S4QYB4_9STRA
MPSLLKRKKSKSSDDSSVTSTSTSLTSKSLKRSKAVGKSLRGFITKGKKKKKKSPESPLREVEESELGSDSDGKPLSFDDTEKTGFNEDIEDETVYGIKIEESQETAPRIEQPASSVDPLRLILLLLDPSSRRFELLQLEFDASRAHVIDVLNQIPLTATEDTLRNKQYRGLCNRAGTEMFKDGLLSECNIEDGVLVAIPRGLTSQESAKLASPILGDPKVLATVSDFLHNSLFFRNCSVVLASRKSFISSMVPSIPHHFNTSLAIYFSLHCYELNSLMNRRNKRRLLFLARRSQRGPRHLKLHHKQQK